MNDTKIVHNSEELKLLGSKLGDVILIIKLQQHIIDWISSAEYQNSDPKFYNIRMNQSLGDIFDSNQSIMSELDEIAWQLLECTNEEELAQRKYKVVNKDE